MRLIILSIICLFSVAVWSQDIPDTKGMTAEEIYLLSQNYFGGNNASKSIGVKLLSIAAEGGCEDAQVDVAYFLLQGDGVAQDTLKALDYYGRAIKNCNIEALSQLAYVYCEGFGVRQNLQKSVDYYVLGAEGLKDRSGNVFAVKPDGLLYVAEKYIKGEGVAQDAAKALAVCEVASSYDVPTECTIASWYRNGVGVKKDCGKAVLLLEKAISGPEADIAYQQLGEMYQNGEGVEKDESKAKEYFRLANSEDSESDSLGTASLKEEINNAINMIEDDAKKGNSESMIAIGFKYERGVYGEVDIKKALEYYNMAADQGDANAYECLGNVYFLASGGIERDFKKAVDYYRKGAQGGNAVCYNQLAYCYAYGYGVEKDFKLAHDLIDKAYIINPSVGYLDSKGEFYLMENKMKEARELWTKLKDNYPEEVNELINTDGDVFCRKMAGK